MMAVEVGVVVCGTVTGSKKSFLIDFSRLLTHWRTGQQKLLIISSIDSYIEKNRKSSNLSKSCSCHNDALSTNVRYLKPLKIKI